MTARRAAVVLVHGLGGSAATMRPLADALGDRTVVTPTLPGHGSDPEALRDTGWTEWRTAVGTAIDEAASAGVRVAVVGQSMGGTLALAAALDEHPVAALVCINTPVLPTDPEALAMLPADDELVDVGAPDIADPSVTEAAYHQLPAAALRELAIGIAEVHARLAEIAVPVLVVTSRLDGVVDPWNADELAALVRGPVSRLALERSGHVASLDLDRDRLATGVLELLADLDEGVDRDAPVSRR